MPTYTLDNQTINWLQWVHGPQTVVMFERIYAIAESEELQWVHGPQTVVMVILCRQHLHRQIASMGPRSSDRGYARKGWPERARTDTASMGPRSSDRGYGPYHRVDGRSANGLQWVHGPQTVVMVGLARLESFAVVKLQWVHGPQTVVMVTVRAVAELPCPASMGPRSSDRGYARPRKRWRLSIQRFNGSTVLRPWLCLSARGRMESVAPLQWVHGPQTVVMPTVGVVVQPGTVSFNGSTVLRPWLCVYGWLLQADDGTLQWVHGPQTVVMYRVAYHAAAAQKSFNGSTVLRPWLWIRRSTGSRSISTLQWVHGPQTVVMPTGRP